MNPVYGMDGVNFASVDEAHEYVANDGTASCERIAARVAARVVDLVERSSSPDDGPATASATVGTHRGG